MAQTKLQVNFQSIQIIQTLCTNVTNISPGLFNSFREQIYTIFEGFRKTYLQRIQTGKDAREIINKISKTFGKNTDIAFRLYLEVYRYEGYWVNISSICMIYRMYVSNIDDSNINLFTQMYALICSYEYDEIPARINEFNNFISDQEMNDTIGDSLRGRQFPTSILTYYKY